MTLALLVTLANAAKPVVVDDTAYLAYARHIAAHPLDPYGFTIFWYTTPEPAFTVLAPPVVPYWLAVGVRLFGEHPALLKLWLFPFLWLFAAAAAALLRRFARDTRLLPLIVFSPAVLPTVNLMLDIPALALGLASVVVFTRAASVGSWRLAIAAGLLAALAMQTKYTMLLIPPVVAWYGLTHGRIRLAIVVVVVAALAFAGWEWVLIEKYGRSHFVFHLREQQAEPQAGADRFIDFFRDKLNLAPGLAGHLGCLGVGAGLVAAGALGLSRTWLRIGAAAWIAGFVFIALAPDRWTARLVPVYWQLFGTAFLAALAGCAVVLSFRFRRGIALRANRDSLFVAGWFAIELVGYFVLTPFPAARRVIGLAVIGGILAARVASRLQRHGPRRRVAGWILGLGIAAGWVVAGVDTLDAIPEKDCAERAAAVAAGGPAGSTVWFCGHWGFQFYCEHLGMRPVVPGESRLSAGDRLVLPVYPDPDGFYRPHVGRLKIQPGPDVAEPIGEVAWDDWLAAQTIPNFYGGIDPVTGRSHPRLRVVVYRVTRDWMAGPR